MFVYLFTFIWQFEIFYDAKPLYLKWKHHFYTNSQSWKQVVGISSGIKYPMVGFSSGIEYPLDISSRLVSETATT